MQTQTIQPAFFNSGTKTLLTPLTRAIVDDYLQSDISKVYLSTQSAYITKMLETYSISFSSEEITNAIFDIHQELENLGYIAIQIIGVSYVDYNLVFSMAYCKKYDLETFQQNSDNQQRISNLVNKFYSDYMNNNYSEDVLNSIQIEMNNDLLLLKSVCDILNQQQNIYNHSWCITHNHAYETPNELKVYISPLNRWQKTS
jgi:hypothetical protein